MAGESYTTKKILLKAVDGTTTQYFIPYVNNATADKTGLVKPDGTTITVDANGTISAQIDISGLQSKIDDDHKLSADLISDGTTNKVVTATEKSTWNGKQDVISDLSTIRANATVGAEAASTIAGYGDIVTHNADEFLTEHQDISGKQDKITSTNKLSADLISEGNTNKLVSASEKSAWNNKQDAISDLDTIRSNAEAGAGAASTIAGYGDVVTHDADEFAEAEHTHTKSQITDFPTIPTVNDAEIEIQQNGTKAGSFTTNQGGSKQTINITVPTSAADVSALPASTKYGSTIDLAVDPDTYVVTATLKDQDGATLSSDTIDLPLESVVVSGSYDNTNKKVILTLQSGSTVEFSVADLVSGLQTEITSTNKLSADLISDGTTNKTVTATEKSTWNSKQDAIDDLSTIRSNAEAGANAATTISSYGDIVTHNADEFAEAEHTHAISDITNLQITLDGKQATISDLSTIRANATAGANAASTIAGYGDIVTHDASEFLTEHQDISGKQDKITSTNKLDADLLVDGVTNKVVTTTEKATWNAKQEAISDLSTIRSNAIAGAEAASTISGYGDIVTHNADEFLTEHQDISGKQDKIDDLATIRSGAAAGATAVQPEDLPTVNDAEIEIQKNGTKVDSFTLNQTLNKTINIAVPTTAADVSALPDSTKYAASLSLSVDPDTYVITGQLKDQDGNNLGTAGTIDLPLESVVVSGSYNSSTKKVVLTLKNGSTVEFSIADLISGLQAEITSTNKLSADLISDGATNKTVTATEKATWNAKQDVILDLDTIRTNASNGASAYTTISGYGDIVTHNADEFANADHIHSQYLTSVAWGDVTGKPSTFTPASHNQASSTINALDEYSKSVSGGTGALETSDTLNQALAKLENALDGKQASGSYATTSDISDMATKTWVGSQGYTSNVGTVTKVNNTTPDADGNVTLSIPSAVTESTVSGWGFTKNEGTVTKVNNVAPVGGNVTLPIPTVTDTYSATSSDAMSGKAVASALSGKADVSAIPTVPTALSAFTDDLGSNPVHTHSQYLTSVIAHNQASDTISEMTSYVKASSAAAINTTDSLNTAVGKLEYKIDDVDAQLQALTDMLNAAS